MPLFHYHPNFAGNSIRLNPSNPQQYIIAAAENFGITGSGRVYIIQQSIGQNSQSYQLVCSAVMPNCAFDAAFNEMDPNTFVVGCGDGIRLFSTVEQHQQQIVQPLAHSKEHYGEVACVSWNPVARPIFATASWDRSVKVIDVRQMTMLDNNSALTRPISIATFGGGMGIGAMVGHAKEVYECGWCPTVPHVLASASGDGSVLVWDIRCPPSKGPAASIAHAHDGKIAMSLSWNYQEPSLLASAGTDNVVRLWDLRRICGGNVATTSADQRCLLPMRGHQGPVRRVRFSPHNKAHLISSGYDCRVCFWDLSRGAQQSGLLAFRHEHHREFVVGLEWGRGGDSMEVATACWDGTSSFWRLGEPCLPTHLSLPLPSLPSCAPPLPPPLPMRGIVGTNHQLQARGPVPALMGARPLPPIPR